MSLLVNKKTKLLKLNLGLFWVLKAIYPLLKIIRSTQKVLKNITKGDWDSIWKIIQIRKWYSRKKARLSYDFSLGLKKISNSFVSRMAKK